MVMEIPLENFVMPFDRLVVCHQFRAAAEKNVPSSLYLSLRETSQHGTPTRLSDDVVPARSVEISIRSRATRALCGSLNGERAWFKGVVPNVACSWHQPQSQFGQHVVDDRMKI